MSPCSKKSLLNLLYFILWNSLPSSHLFWDFHEQLQENLVTVCVCVCSESVSICVKYQSSQRESEKRKTELRMRFSSHLLCFLFGESHRVCSRICIKLQTLLFFLHLFFSSILSSPSKLNDPFISWWPTEALRCLCMRACLCVCCGSVRGALKAQLHVKFTTALIL